jgi:exosortase F-associated protein
MQKSVKYILIALLSICLILIRAFEETLFYDPFILYFQNDYLYTEIPDFDVSLLFVNLLYRYVLNAVISLGIIYLAFGKLGYVILAAKLYVVAFFILAITFCFLLGENFENGYLLPFYVRRFLVHPLFLLLLLAAFYYEKLTGTEPTLEL